MLVGTDWIGFFGIRSFLVFRVTVPVLFAASTAMAASDSSGADGRAPMQDWKSFPEFLREGHWNVLQSAEERQLKKIEVLSRHLVDMGLRHPSERTMTTLASVVSHCSGQHNDEDSARLQALLQTVKSVLKAHTVRARQVAAPVFTAYLQTLPASVAELPEAMREHFFPGGAFQPPVDLPPIYASAALWPCRSTNRQVSLARQLTAGGNMLMNGSGSLAAVAQQAALQTAAAFASMSRSSSGGFEVPGLEILPAGQRAMAHAQAQMTSRQTPLAALMNRAESQGVPSAPAVMDRAQLQGAPSVPVSMDTEPSQGVPKASESGPATGPAVARPATALPACVAPASVGDPALQSQTEISAPVADQAQEELDRCVMALSQEHYGSTLPDLPDADAPEAGKSSGQGAKRGRPAGKAAAKRPAACPKTLAKKPGCNIKTVLKKPAGNTQSALKKPAGNFRDALTKPADGRDLKSVTRQQALRQRPEGCSRCRHTPGCCPSCWTQRGYRVLQ